MRALDAQVVEQGDVVASVGVPAILRGHGGAGTAGVALIHGDDAEVGRQLGDGVERRGLPERSRRAHPAGGEQQHREAAAVVFVVKPHIVAFKDRHVASMSCVGMVAAARVRRRQADGGT